MSLNDEVRAVLARCEKTASWYGIRVSTLAQRNHLQDTPLHTVCTWGELEPVKLLVDAGADVNARGDKGCTPLFNAVMGENADVVTFLLSRGANAAIRSPELGSVLDYARSTSSEQEIVKALQKASALGK
jgi:uncharacterized protein